LGERKQLTNLLVSAYDHIKIDNKKLKEAQRQINHLNKHLYDKVIERTASLQAEIEEKNKIQSELRSLNAFNESLLSTLPFAIDIVDEKGTVLFFNKVFEKMTGGDIMGKNCWELYKDDKQQCTHCPLRKEIRTEETKKIESQGMMGGRTFEINHSGIIFNEKKAILEVFHDVTDYKLTEQVLRESESKLSEAQRIAHIGTWNYDVVEDKVVWSPEIFSITGLDPGQGAPALKDHQKFIHSDDLTEFENLVQRGIKEALPFSYEFRINTPDGKLKWAWAIGKAIRNEKGEATQLYGTVQDITERKRSEILQQALYRIARMAVDTSNLNDLYKQVHEVIMGIIPARNFYIALYDEASNIVSFPYFSDEVDSPPPTGPLRKGMTEFVIRTGKALFGDKVTMEKLIKDGVMQIIGEPAATWLGVPMILENKTIGVMAVQHYSDPCAYQLRDLEMLGYVSTQVATVIHKKLVESELIKAKETAEASSRLKSSLLANMSHELRTPMNGILGFSELLSESLPDPIQKSMASNILLSGHRLMTTLDSIMDLSQIQADKRMLKPEMVNLSDECRSVLQKFNQKAVNKQLTLKENFLTEIYVNVDRSILRKIIDNLVDNAIKFTLYGTVTITIDQEKSSEGDWALIRVTDTGIGIEKENYEIIFEEFRQLSEGFGRSFEGSGLGLTLCKKFLDLINGEITVESIPGQGSSFTVRLPVSQETNEYFPDKKKIPDEVTGHTAKSDLLTHAGKPFVLIVEDNELNIQLIRIYLEDDYLTDACLDGETAINMVENKQYDAILMDINLGEGLDGVDTSLEIRKIKGYENRPVIAITGYTTTEEKMKILSNGCSHYLPKPFNKEDLLLALKLALE
ncbi:MAG: ATP-binding protein, partial [Bacteroidetes bacterium]|nr:ATP-binding protein [Bacteroidota bacterium]